MRGPFITFFLYRSLFVIKKDGKDTNLSFLKNFIYLKWREALDPAFTCSKLTIETLEQGVKYVQS